MELQIFDYNISMMTPLAFYRGVLTHDPGAFCPTA